jgi:4-nitrophenyl phosphatase
VFFLTNISGASSANLAAKLTRMGINTEAGQVLAPLRVIDKHPSLAKKKKALVIGTEAVRQALYAAGVEVLTDPAEAAVVVVGRDPTMTYAQLAAAAQALDLGANLLAINLDLRVPGANGRFVPGNGAIVAALVAATGVEPELIGKPSTFYFQQALETFAISEDNTVMVGDSLDSDVAGGAKVGLMTVLVGGGVGQETADVKPDLYAPDLLALHNLMELPCKGQEV